MLFFDLLQVALGNRKSLERIPTEAEWEEMFQHARRQTLMGIAFSGMEQLPQEQRPSTDFILKWYTVVSMTEKLNLKKNALCSALQQNFLKNGLRTCILKGQGVAQYYEQPLRRQSGDIDIWVEGGWRKVLEYVYAKRPGGGMAYHHVDLGRVRDVKVEAHFTPSWMYNPFKNKYLQKWFYSQAERQFTNKKEVRETNNDGNIDTRSSEGEHTDSHIQCVFPTDLFNTVFLLLHMYRHIFDDGLGLRQLLDYYELLKAQSLSKEETKEATEVIEKLGMTRFARAVAWLLMEVFGMKEEDMFVTPDEKQGRFLLDEVMQSGNFGYHDERMEVKAHEGKWHKFARRQKRNLRFLGNYPSEVLWRPYFILFNLLWRKRAKKYVAGFLPQA